MKIFKTITILLTQLYLTLLLVQRANSECCNPTILHFYIAQPSNKKCTDFPEGRRVHFSTIFCYTKICGSFKRPTPCCGVHSCNIFCCSCNCWYRNMRVLVDYRTRFWKVITDVYQRNLQRTSTDDLLEQTTNSNSSVQHLWND
ncbi:hypothetical protein ACLKA7_004578 [Drosophila subpalustris]